MEKAASYERIPPHGDDSEPRPPGAHADSSPSWRLIFHDLIDRFGASIGTRVELVKLESRRAIRASQRAIVMAILGALLAITGWFALVAGLVVWAVHEGATLHWALLCVAAAGVILAWASLYAVRKAIASIRFDATRRALHFNSGADGRKGRAAASGSPAGRDELGRAAGRSTSTGGTA